MNSLFKNISWLGSANILVKPLWLVFITVACMRVLHPEGYGVMNTALAFAAMGMMFTDLGMSQYSVREVARDRTQASLFFTNFMTAKLVLGVAGAAVTMTASYLLGYRDTYLIAIAWACLYTLSLAVSSYCKVFYQAYELLKVEAIMLYVEKGIVISLGLVALLFLRSAQGTLSGIAIGMAITAGIHIGIILRRFASYDLSLLARTFLRGSLGAILPIGLAGLLFTVYYRIDLVMISYLLGDESAGHYGAAYRLLEALNMLPAVVVFAALFPKLSRLADQQQHSQFDALLKRSSLLLMGTCTGIVAIVWLAAPLIINVLEPSGAYEPAQSALRILVWVFPVSCANALMFCALISYHIDRFPALAVAVALVVNVALNAWTIPAFGINGAASATIASEALVLGLLLSRYLRKT